MDEKGRWVTVRGRRVFIKEGQTISEAIQEYESKKNQTTTTYYRGLTQKYDPNYDKSKLDNQNGYESWTDSLELAKEYAGKDGYVYSVEIPNKELNTDDIFDEEGERSLMYYNDKPVALHGVEGEEFMLYTDHEKWNDLEYKEVGNESKNKYQKSEFDNIGNKTVVKLENGEIIQELSKKEYNKMAEDFASSLTKEELTMIQKYVDCPGISGDLNDFNKINPDGSRGSTRYLYNNTETEYFTTQNEINKYYTDLIPKFEKEVRPLNDINPSWAKDDERAWAKTILGEDASYSATEDLLKNLYWRRPDNPYPDNDRKYYSQEEIQEAKEKREKMLPLIEERRKYTWKDKEYEELSNEINKLGEGKSEYTLRTIADIDSDRVFNSAKYDFDKELDKKNIQFISTKEVYDKRNENNPQSSSFKNIADKVSEDVNGFNKLFEEKGITLEKDIIVFRRGRETNEQVKEGFTMYGLTSCTAFDNLPKKMPSGNSFGEQRYYILLPSGTKILLAEQVIGRGDNSGEYEDVYKGVRRQHEILLAPGTSFERLTGGYTETKGKTEYSTLLTIKKGGNYYD